MILPEHIEQKEDLIRLLNTLNSKIEELQNEVDKLKETNAGIPERPAEMRRT